MTLTTSSRKRDRSATDDSDYTPVTKRMNNLHIDAVVAVGPNELNDPLIGGHNGLNGDSNNCLMNQMQAIHHHNHIQQQQQQQHCLLQPHPCLEHSANHNVVNGHHPHGHNHHQQHHNHGQCLATYRPELDSNSNPIYYESNRILFEAHLQRQQRLSITGGHQRKS